MTSIVSLSKAIARGFVRDRTAVFFTVLFPLMFLLLFGGIFKDQTAPKSEVIQVGAVSLLDDMPADAKTGLSDILELTRADDRAAALEQVRKGDVDAMVEQSGGTIVLHYSAADQVTAGTVNGLFSSLVNAGNLAAAGVTAPAFTLQGQQVEDESLGTIQYVTPGLLGWAIATGATFGAAMTLVTWRHKKLLRRLRLAPINVGSVLAARVGVSIVIALVQMAIFLGVAVLPYFGLVLSDSWWMSIPLVLVGTLAFLSIGLLAGSFAKTPEAANVIANLVVLPMAFLSGAFFPLDNAPGWLQAVGNALPLKHLVDGMQAVMVRGESPGAVLPQLGILAAFAVVTSAIAALLFRWDDV
ncbi:ABC transporter permease [Luedemannella helvata]|uniref:Transport permease protein n=1 Tax=Luedemannella helvata TaxID=349315 RepID=A0ABN2JR81_9ACTN